MTQRNQDFFERQQAALTLGRVFTVLFILTTLFISALIGVLLEHYHSEYFHKTTPAPRLEHTAFLSMIAFVIICIGSLIKIYQIRNKGMVELLESAGALQVSRLSTDPAIKQYMNITDEMAIASGLPIPLTFVIPDEPSINAFTAGLTPSTACICVTDGALKHLSRAELQGVIAHEYSHILHGDVLFNTKMLGTLNGYIMFAAAGYYLMRFAVRSRSSRSKGGGRGAILALGFTLYIVGYLGIFLATILRAAFNRQREWLADASAVQFTRNQDGIRGALIKIDSNIHQTMNSRTIGESYSHMCLVRAVSGFWSRVFASHPPTEKRIHALGQPDYKSREDQDRVHFDELPNNVGEQRPFDDASDLVLSGISADSTHDPSKKVKAEIRKSFERSKAGSMTSESLESAHRTIQSLPKALLGLLDSNQRAFAALAGIVIFKSSTDPIHQLTKLKESKIESITFFDFIRDEVFPHVKKLENREAHALAQIISKTLYSQDTQTLLRQLELLAAVTESDHKITVNELSLVLTFAATIADRVNLPRFGQRDKRDPLPDIIALIAYVAHLASESDHASAQRGYQIAAGELGIKYPFPAKEESQKMRRLVRGLGHVKALSIKNRLKFVQALLKCAQSDQHISESEYHVLRSLCTSLDCPFPIS